MGDRENYIHQNRCRKNVMISSTHALRRVGVGMQMNIGISWRLVWIACGLIVFWGVIRHNNDFFDTAVCEISFFAKAIFDTVYDFSWFFIVFKIFAMKNPAILSIFLKYMSHFAIELNLCTRMTRG